MAVLFCFTNGEVIEAVKRRWQRWRMRLVPESRSRATTRSRSVSSPRDRPSTLVVFSGNSTGCRTPTALAPGSGLMNPMNGGSSEHLATLTPNAHSNASAEISSHSIIMPLRNNSAASGSSRGTGISAVASPIGQKEIALPMATNSKGKDKSGLNSKVKSKSKQLKSETKEADRRSSAGCCLLGNGVDGKGTPTPPMGREKYNGKGASGLEEIHLMIEARTAPPPDGATFTKPPDLNPI